MTGSAGHAQRATIYSVAEAAGVSIATVSRVFQGTSTVAQGTRERVLSAADELNYMPLGAARSLAVSRHELLGLVLPELGGPYYSELLMGFESRASELGLGVIVVVTEGKPDPTRAIRQLMSRVDAVAVLGSDLDDAGLAQLATAKPLALARRVARWSRSQPGRRERHERPGADRATSCSTAAGRCSSSATPTPVPTSPAGMPVSRLHTRLTASTCPSRSASACRRATARPSAAAYVVGEHSADALVCANDELALAVLTHLQDHGIAVPDDVAVVGWDDVMTARYVRPALTTVRQPVHDLGALARERLHDQLSVTSDASASHDILPTQVVIRSSCGCPAHPLPKGTSHESPPRRESTTRRASPSQAWRRPASPCPPADAKPRPATPAPAQRPSPSRAARRPATSPCGPWAPRARSSRPSPRSSRPPTPAPRSTSPPSRGTPRTTSSPPRSPPARPRTPPWSAHLDG